MREIKFRGRNNFDEWIYGNFVMSNNIHPAIYFEVGSGSVKTIDWQSVVLESVGQFTGYKDKNQQDIYEGDIVSEKTESGIFIYQVVWLEDRFVFQSMSGNINIGIATQYTEVIIIGNLYEKNNRK